MTARLQRLAQETLAIWVQRVVDVRSRQMSVSQDRDGKIVHSAFVRWKKRTRKRLQDHSLAESFQDVKQEGKLLHFRTSRARFTSRLLDLLRRSFWTWNATMHAILDRRRKAEERGRADRTVLLTAAFDKWRSKARKLKLSRLVRDGFGTGDELRTNMPTMSLTGACLWQSQRTGSAQRESSQMEEQDYCELIR